MPFQFTILTKSEDGPCLYWCTGAGESPQAVADTLRLEKRSHTLIACQSADLGQRLLALPRAACLWQAGLCGARRANAGPDPRFLYAGWRGGAPARHRRILAGGAVQPVGAQSGRGICGRGQLLRVAVVSRLGGICRAGALSARQLRISEPGGTRGACAQCGVGQSRRRHAGAV